MRSEGTGIVMVGVLLGATLLWGAVARADDEVGTEPSAGSSHSSSHSMTASSTESSTASPSGSSSPTDAPSETPSSTPSPTDEHTTYLVCLATGDGEAPYTATLVAGQDVINGHGQVKPDGPGNSPVGVFPDEPWGNIIPPLSHPQGATFSGLNFGTEGQAIWADGCGAASPPSSPPPHDHTSVVVCEAQTEVDVPYALATYAPTRIVKGNGSIISGGPADTVEGVYPVEPWGTIVPPFIHHHGKEFPGVNWSAAGQAIWAAECVYVAPTPEPSPPVVPVPPAPAPAAPSQEPTTAAPVEEPASVVPVVPAPEPTEVAVPAPAVVDPEEPETVTVPQKATVPSSVPAGMAP